MKNNIYSFFFIFFLNYFAFLFSAQAEQFNFDVKEIEIKENNYNFLKKILSKLFSVENSRSFFG